MFKFFKNEPQLESRQVAPIGRDSMTTPNPEAAKKFQEKTNAVKSLKAAKIAIQDQIYGPPSTVTPDQRREANTAFTEIITLIEGIESGMIDFESADLGKFTKFITQPVVKEEAQNNPWGEVPITRGGNIPHLQPVTARPQDSRTPDIVKSANEDIWEVAGVADRNKNNSNRKAA